jgi:hypothetical protein
MELAQATILNSQSGIALQYRTSVSAATGRSFVDRWLASMAAMIKCPARYSQLQAFVFDVHDQEKSIQH